MPEIDEDILCPVCEKNERAISEYGPRFRYATCDDCADGEPDYQGVTIQEQYEQAWKQKRSL